MNKYYTDFIVKCPTDNDLIIYSLEIKSEDMIRVEHIKTEVSLIKEGYHENIADRLKAKFGGVQTITAAHQGVKIVTTR